MAEGFAEERDLSIGTTLNAIAHLEQRFGDIHIDLARPVAFGLDPCVVEKLEVNGDEVTLVVQDKVSRNTAAILKMRNLDREQYNVRISDAEPQLFSRGDLTSGIRVWIAAREFEGS